MASEIAQWVKVLIARCDRLSSVSAWDPPWRRRKPAPAGMFRPPHHVLEHMLSCTNKCKIIIVIIIRRFVLFHIFNNMCHQALCLASVFVSWGYCARDNLTHSHLSGALFCSNPYSSTRAGSALRQLSCPGYLRTSFFLTWVNLGVLL